MPLLNKKLLQDAILKHKSEINPIIRQHLLDHLTIKVYNRIEKGTFKKEEAEKPVILPKLFELLGYSHPETFEFEFGVNTRSADLSLGLETNGIRNVEVAVEWKGIDTRNLDKGKAGETPVSQMYDYMGKTNADFGIVSNFEEFRLYSKQKGQTEFHKFSLREIVTTPDKLDEFIFLLGKQTLLKNGNKQSLLESLISQSESEQEKITKDFYKDYKQRRLNLFQHLVENNREINKHILLEKSQKILDRLVFIMFCEDGLLLPNGTIKQVYHTAKNSFGSQTRMWDQFKGLFLAIDKGNDYPKINAFNGGLFVEDLELNSLVIKDEIWLDLIKLAEYDFESDLNVNILGHIFEQSISDIEDIKVDMESGNYYPEPGGAPFEKGISKRKKDGIYYTPEYITNYIVSETIGGWLKDQESIQNNLLTLINLENPISADLQKVLNIILETDAIYQPGESIANSWQNLNLNEFFNYISSWYFYNDLSLADLNDWPEKSDNTDVSWLLNMANLLVNICKTAKVENCFDLDVEHFQVPTTSNPLESIRVLDPAGGSGAFPNQVHNFLTKEYVKRQNEIAISQGLENFVGDETTIDKSILKNNIFMVDLQPESVEIAKLSLWLKTAKKDQKLNNLDNNIKCGNSLIDDPEIAGDKAFDWEKEFGGLSESQDKNN